MIKSLILKNYGPLAAIEWKGLGKVNLVIGNNGTGKTFLLKAAYSAVKASEEYKRGDEPRKLSEILSDKLYWTFQTEKLGDLVAKGQTGKLEFRMEMDEGTLAYSFGESTVRTLLDIIEPSQSRSSNSLFLPEKEILTLYKVIIDSRERAKLFGFDDTYYDLAKVISIGLKKREELPGIFRRKAEYSRRCWRQSLSRRKRSLALQERPLFVSYQRGFGRCKEIGYY